MDAVHTQIVVDEVSGKTHVNRVQDCEPIMDSVKRIQNLTPSKEMRHVARIPMVVVEAYCNRVGITYRDWLLDPAHLSRMLDDPDLKAFRTNPV
jgi:hypothetical protein